METSVTEVIEACARQAHEGTRAFPAIVSTLSESGVEAYHADYRAKRTTYYLPSGAQHAVSLHAPAVTIAAAFDATALQTAIRGSQRGEVKYPEFLERSMRAGCVGYIVWIAGKQVTYFGRLGEVHVEKFPSQP